MHNKIYLESKKQVFFFMSTNLEESYWVVHHSSNEKIDLVPANENNITRRRCCNLPQHNTSQIEMYQ